jgi:phospholipase/carboxylesterase
VQAREVNGTALKYILVTPEGFTAAAGYPLVVLLHGFGANMQDLASLAPYIDDTGYVYAFPNAPFEVQLGPGYTGYSWATGRPGMSQPLVDTSDVDAMLETFMQEVTSEAGAAAGKAVLGGFSQGGGLTLRFGLPRPETFAGLAVLSGFFRDQEAVEKRLPAERKQRLFVAHGTVDNVVAIEGGRGTKTFLEGAGYDFEYHEYPIAHEISPDEIADLKRWLHETLPPHGV